MPEHVTVYGSSETVRTNLSRVFGRLPLRVQAVQKHVLLCPYDGLWVGMIYRGVFCGFVDLFVSRGLAGRDLRFRAASWPDGGPDAGQRLGCAHGCAQRAAAHDVHDPFEIVGQHVPGHFGADLLQRLHLVDQGGGGLEATRSKNSASAEPMSRSGRRRRRDRSRLCDAASRQARFTNIGPAASSNALMQRAQPQLRREQ